MTNMSLVTLPTPEERQKEYEKARATLEKVVRLAELEPAAWWNILQLHQSAPEAIKKFTEGQTRVIDALYKRHFEDRRP